jgi:16S rRNA (cytidine1402-2'-O)-methyltransferase
MSTLFLVATPIGNLGDMSRRAIQTLQDVNLIAAEDTRHTRKLLTHFEISNRLLSYHEHNQEKAIEPILEALENGDVALVSDAGTPSINDPGYRLVKAAVAEGHTVSPIPGASAPISALIASGLPTDSFLYLGYLPRKKGERRKLLADNSAQPHTLIFLETPHRLVESLKDMVEVFGDREAVVARELTKLYEEFVRGTVPELLAHFQKRPPKGEITLLLAGETRDLEVWELEDLHKAIVRGLSDGESASGLAKRLSGESGWPRRQIYNLIQEKNR